MFCSLKRWIRHGSSALFLLGVLACEVPAANGQMVLLPDNRIIIGRVAEIAADQVKIYTTDVMPRYLSVKQAEEKGIWPLHKGDYLHIVVNEQNMVLGYHPIGDMGSHHIIHGQLAQPLMVGQEWAVVKPEGKDEQIYRVRELVRSKLAAVPIGFPAVFLIDETNQIMDTAFTSDEALRVAAKNWQGSSPKGVNRQLMGTIVKAVTNGEVTIRTEDSRDLTMDVRPFLRDKVETLSLRDNVIMLLDDEDKIADVAFRQ